MEKLKKNRLVVVGGGAAGMLSAILAAKGGWQVLLLEQNEKLGKKLFITGKGRCNITNACGMEELFQHVSNGGKFMYSAFYGFNNYDMMDFLESLSLPLKTERGGRVFPKSDKSSDVIKALEEELKRCHVEVMLNTKVTDIDKGEFSEEEEPLPAAGKKSKKAFLGKVLGVHAVVQEKGKIGKRKFFPAEAVFIATGGASYPSTGSTGDGYRFAKDSGHTIVEPVPSLVPLETKETFVKDLMGLSLKNIAITVYKGKKELYHDFGEMLFTHFGVSGPVILSASSAVARELQKQPLELSIDLKPALSEEQLDARLIRDFTLLSNKQFKNALDKLLPKTLIPVVIEKTGISKEKKINLLTKQERLLLVHVLKDFRLTLTGTRGFAEAIITKGGVSLKEIQPSTMESKKIKNLYFLGEVLDADALTGGFNLQIAWSTAAAAANSLSIQE
jgi:predicted flavoprotein YhiN